MLWFHLNPTSEQDYDTFWHITRMTGFCMRFVFYSRCIEKIPGSKSMVSITYIPYLWVVKTGMCFLRKFHVQSKWIDMTKENIHFSTSRNTESLYYPFMYDWNSTNLKKKIQSRFCTALHPLLLPRHPRKMIIIFQRNSITEFSSCHQLYVIPV